MDVFGFTLPPASPSSARGGNTLSLVRPLAPANQKDAAKQPKINDTLRGKISHDIMEGPVAVVEAMASKPNGRARESQISGELTMAAFAVDWLKTCLDEHPKALAQFGESGGIILTAGTPELQRFISQHLGQGRLFKNECLLVRLAAGERC